MMYVGLVANLASLVKMSSWSLMSLENAIKWQKFFERSNAPKECMKFRSFIENLVD